MPKAEGKILKFLDISHIDRDVLEVFPYKMKEVIFKEEGESNCEIIEDENAKNINQTIKYESDELSALCPFSGLPDYSKLKVTYIPNKYVMELKSFKYYLLSYRNVGIYQEHLTQEIYKDLDRVLKPYFLEVETIYNTRGGINTCCNINSKTADIYK